jgi:DNA-binding cell septation regulator SpoVG
LRWIGIGLALGLISLNVEAEREKEGEPRGEPSRIRERRTMSHNGIEITEIKVNPIKNRQPDSPLEAFVRVVLNGQFVISSIKVVKGKFGLFVSFPREYNKSEGKGYNLCYPITKPLQEYMSQRILDEYKLAAVA